jgi:aryl-alcohol dehydrogenase-like predicted oxidoreductase
VVATKYTLSMQRDDPNAGGNGRKNLVQSLEASLRRLGTDYVDLLWLHMWDGMTPLEEVMRGLDDVVRSGKALYVGLSDTPAWVVARAVELAVRHGWVPPVAVQAPYSISDRSVERELLPMAAELDLAFTPWGILSGGALTGKYDDDAGEPTRYDSVGERTRAIARAVVAVAREVERPPAQVALAWVRARKLGAVVVPILGARTAAQLRSTLGALDLELAPEHVHALDAASDFRLGFPRDFLEDEEVRGLIFGDTYALIDDHRRRSTI